MKSKAIIAAGSIAFLVLFATLLTSGACAQGKVKPAEAKKIAKEAYIFNYPLVMMYRSMYQQALDPKNGVGLGNWLHLGTSSPKDTTIVSPNNDSPYSYAWVDLRAEPWVVTLPKIEKNRFYKSFLNMDDLHGFIHEYGGRIAQLTLQEYISKLVNAPVSLCYIFVGVVVESNIFFLLSIEFYRIVSRIQILGNDLV